MTDDLLLRGGHVLTGSAPEDDLGVVDVLISGGVIQKIGANLVAPAARTMDMSGSFVTPGLVDCHSHLWEWPLRNIGTNWSWADYHYHLRGVLGSHYEPEDIRAGTLLGAVEAMNSGVTTVFDCSHNLNSPDHADAAIQGLRASGLRAVFAYGSASTDWDPNSSWNSATMARSLPSGDIRRVRDEYFSEEPGLVTMALSSRGSRGVGGDDALFRDVRLARELGIMIAFESGNRGSVREGSELVALHEAGLMGEHIMIYHADELTDEELRIVADSGARVVFTPETEFRGAAAVADTSRLIDAGVYPGIGVDTPVQADDLFDGMKLLIAAQGARQRFAALHSGERVLQLQLPLGTVFDIATRHGAHACGMGSRTGQIKVGMRADVIAFRKDALGLMPVYNPIAAIVLTGHSSAVSTVIIDGKVVKSEGRLRGVDLSRVVDDAVRSREAVFERAGLRRDLPELVGSSSALQS